MTDKSRTIIGIDPGTNILGFGIVRVDAAGKPHYVDMGVVDLRKIDWDGQRLRDAGGGQL